MTREENKEKLIAFLRTIWRSDVPVIAIDENTPLIEAGLIDSLAIVQIITFLESDFKIDFINSDADPSQLDSISAILDVIGRNAA